jgi:hypothetical protein
MTLTTFDFNVGRKVSRPTRKAQLALLAASIREGYRPSVKELAGAMGVSTTMIYAAERLTVGEWCDVQMGTRALLDQAPALALAPPVNDSALAEIVRTAGVDRVLNAVEPFLS